MDLNTVEEVVRTADPAQWREGDAWLAGGTVLFSYGGAAFGKEPLRRLLDLGSTGWAPLAVSAAGIELAATCTIAQLYAFPDSEAGRGRAGDVARAGARPALLRLLRGVVQGLEHVHGGREPVHLPAGRAHDLALRRARRHRHPARTRRRHPHASRAGSRHGGRDQLPRSRRAPAQREPAGVGPVLPGGLPPVVAEPPGQVRGAADRKARRRRRPGPDRHRCHEAPRAAASEVLPGGARRRALGGAGSGHPGSAVPRRRPWPARLAQGHDVPAGPGNPG